MRQCETARQQGNVRQREAQQGNEATWWDDEAKGEAMRQHSELMKQGNEESEATT
jgi:hypothetical protein